MKRQLESLFLGIFLCSIVYSQPSPPNIAPLPMHLYQVQGSESGDANCPSSVNLQQLTIARQLTLRRYSDLKEAASFEAYDTAMRELWYKNDSNIRVIVPAAGTYIGIEDIVEYIALVVGVANDGFAHYYNARVSGFKYYPNNSSYSFKVDQKVKFYCRRAPTTTDPGDCQTGEIDSIALHHVSFEPCTPLLKQYVIGYDDYQNYLATKGARLITICMRHEQHCTTPQTRQFRDIFDCMKYYETIPFTTCGAEVFNGDNALCRFKHSFMVKFRPEKHCAHIGRNSKPCTDADCDGDFRSCTSKPGEITYTPRLSTRCCRRPYCVTRTRCAWNGIFEFKERKCAFIRRMRRRRRYRRYVW